ncbi:hypothetical protein DL93DRAFT_2085430 [Clavulina sp. PMI_390]|nr:hypothetical protein DL93DRAFT_2085430 [Clavulina sp. PMI_390]
MNERSSIGPLWIEKINFDIIFTIASWLDPLSAVRLSFTCKLLRGLIGNQALSYYQTMRNVYTRYCIAPHSFPNLLVQDLKRFSARSDRLLKAFKDPEMPLQATMEICTLNYEAFFPAASPENIGTTRRVEYLDPYLLPGGRWILSGIIVDDTQFTHLVCWDRTASHIGESSLQPIARYTWEGFRPTSKTNWLTSQLHGSYEVSLAFSLRQGGR